MNLNLKMTVERSKRRSYFLSLVFITKAFLLILEINVYQEQKSTKPKTDKKPI